MRGPTWILRDPLTHFLLLGGAVFATHAAFGAQDPRDSDEKVITVDRDALLTFMQYRASAFEPDYFEAQYEALSPQQLRQLAQAYVQEEAMTREARALELEKGDYVIRRRLVQKIDFLLDDAGGVVEAPSEDRLRRFFDANRDAYRVAPTYTFSHVFVDDEKAHPGGGQAAARALQGRLRAKRAGFNDAPAYGDRFPYLQNYVSRDERFIADQFGEEFASQLAKLRPGATWQGPIRSRFGYHLVYLTDRARAETPKFEDVRLQVEEDYRDQRFTEQRQALLNDLVKQYEVVYRDVPLAGGADKP